MTNLFKMFFPEKAEAEAETTNREPRKFLVPADKVEKLLSLRAAYKEKKGNADVEFYLMWKFIEDMFPDTMAGAWKMSALTGTRMYVEEILPE